MADSGDTGRFSEMGGKALKQPVLQPFWSPYEQIRYACYIAAINELIV